MDAKPESLHILGDEMYDRTPNKRRTKPWLAQAR